MFGLESPVYYLCYFTLLDIQICRHKLIRSREEQFRYIIRALRLGAFVSNTAYLVYH
jgi:hypothetical protein